MEYYKYIKRELDSSIYSNAKLIFWKERYKRIIKLAPTLYDYTFTFKPIDILSLPYDFINNIYIPNILKKNNCNPSDIVSKIKEWIEKGNTYIFLEVMYQNNLIWWKILVIKKGINIVSGRSALHEEHQYINQYIEYLFINFAFENNVKTLGVGISPNICGHNMWSWPAVALHKLELHYTPLVTKHSDIWNININTIKSESIIFITEDDKKYSKAIIIRPKNKPHDIRYNLLSKRWITISYHYF